MATIKKQGRGYKITVSCGYDIHGRQIRRHMTWNPEPGMTERQIEKELRRQEVLFEESVKASDIRNPNIKLKEFTEIFMRDYANKKLKERTAYGYEQNIVKINEALGHIRLRELRPKHITMFYNNLAEKGLRVDELAYVKGDFAQILKGKKLTMVEVHRRCGVAVSTMRRLKLKQPIAKSKALILAATLEIPAAEMFLFTKDTDPLSAGSILVVHRTLSSILGRAVKWGYIDENPAAKADLPRKDRREAPFLDEDQAKELLDLLRVVSVRWRIPIIVDMMTGLRRGELAGLRWEDVDLKRNLIYIRQTWNYTPRKGCYADTPKTRDSNRPLKVSNSVSYLLQEYKAWQDEQKELMGDAWEDQDGRVFTTDTGAPVHPDTYSKWFTEFIKGTDLPKVTLHSLRHTYASLMIFDGVPLITVSHQLGHAETSTTANIYSHVIASAEALAAQTFDRFDDEILGDKHQINTKAKIS